MLAQPQANRTTRTTTTTHLHTSNYLRPVIISKLEPKTSLRHSASAQLYAILRRTSLRKFATTVIATIITQHKPERIVNITTVVTVVENIFYKGGIILVKTFTVLLGNVYCVIQTNTTIICELCPIDIFFLRLVSTKPLLLHSMASLL